MTEEKEPKTIKDLLNILDKRAKADDERFAKMEESMLKISTDVASMNEALNKGIPNIVNKLKEHDQVIGAIFGTGQTQPAPTQPSTTTQTSPNPQAQANPMAWLQYIPLIRGLLGGQSSSSPVDGLKSLSEMAKAFADTADALNRFRNPSPWSPEMQAILDDWKNMSKQRSRGPYRYEYEGKEEEHKE